MKVSPKFRLRDPNAGTTSIFLDLCWSGKRAIYGTGLTIDPILWDHRSMRATKTNKTLKDYKKSDPKAWEHNDRINKQLNRISDAVTDFFIRAGDKTTTPDELRSYLNQEIRPEKASSQPTTLIRYIDHFINEIASGRLQTPKGTKYSDTTVRAYNSFRYRFLEFQSKKKKVYDFEDIDLDFYDKFTAYLTSIGNKPNSAGKQIKCLKSILRSALDLKIHSNRTFQSRKFKVQRIDTDKVYLTKEELSRIAALELSSKPALDITRDVFLIGCYTAQRISDYSRITKNNITKTGQGYQVIDLNQIKTGTRVIIPIKPELLRLLKKYDYTVPYVVEQKLNQRIKDVAKLAGIVEPIQITEYIKGVKVLKHVPKYSLIQSHSARRTGATLMKLAGIPLDDIQKITGHKTIKELMQYIRVSEEETAEILALHPYFSSIHALK